MKRIASFLLLVSLYGCTTARPTPSAPSATGQAPAPAPAQVTPASPGRRADLPACGQPVKPGEPGIWIDIATRAKQPPSWRMLPGWIIPVPPPEGAYEMELHVPDRFDVKDLHVSVESDAWRFAPNSGALKPLEDAVSYEFAVEPTQSPAPATVFVTVAGVKRANGSNVETGTFSVQVYGPGEQVPACDAAQLK